MAVLHQNFDGVKAVVFNKLLDLFRSVVGHKEVHIALGEKRKQTNVVNFVVRVESRASTLAALSGIGRIDKESNIVSSVLLKSRDYL